MCGHSFTSNRSLVSPKNPLSVHLSPNHSSPSTTKLSKFGLGVFLLIQQGIVKFCSNGNFQLIVSSVFPFWFVPCLIYYLSDLQCHRVVNYMENFFSFFILSNLKVNFSTRIRYCEFERLASVRIYHLKDFLYCSSCIFFFFFQHVYPHIYAKTCFFFYLVCPFV